jgi:hypothetical protein
MNSVASDNSTVDGPIDNVSPLLMTMKIVNDGVHRTFYNYTAGAFDQFYQEANNAFLIETDIGFGGVVEASTAGYIELQGWSLT